MTIKEILLDQLQKDLVELNETWSKEQEKHQKRIEDITAMTPEELEAKAIEFGHYSRGVIAHILKKEEEKQE